MDINTQTAQDCPPELLALAQSDCCCTPGCC